MGNYSLPATFGLYVQFVFCSSVSKDNSFAVYSSMSNLCIFTKLIIIIIIQVITHKNG